MIEKNLDELLSEIASKSLVFAVRIVKMCRYISDNYKEYQLTVQVKRSGTNIGASAAKAVVASTKSDKFTKISVSLKEAKETDYWLKVLWQTRCLTDNQYQDISRACDEIIQLLMSAMSFKGNKSES